MEFKDSIQQKVIADIIEERKRQNAKFGEQAHDMYRWLAILDEERGEASKAMLEHEFGGQSAHYVRAEMLQVAAVATAIVECIDRHGGSVFPSEVPIHTGCGGMIIGNGFHYVYDRGLLSPLRGECCVAYICSKCDQQFNQCCARDWEQTSVSEAGKYARTR